MNVLVIGGGAAGMMAAVAAAGAGAKVTLLEKNEKLGKKIYITGKGRCNVTNACEDDEFFSHIFRNSKFMYSSFRQFGSTDMMDFLSANGLELKVERGRRVFPFSDKASDVTATLEAVMRKRRVKIRLGAKVKEIYIMDAERIALENAKAPRAFGVVLEDGEKVFTDRIIIATGGLAYPGTGSTGDGYAFAKAVGHSIIEPRPSLVPFDAELPGADISQLSGLTLKNIRVSLLHGSKCIDSEVGELLFTHFGVSGPTVLSISGRADVKRGDLLVLDLKIALDPETLDARMLREIEANRHKDLGNFMCSLLPKSLVPAFLHQCELPAHIKACELTREQRLKVVGTLKNFVIVIKGTRGYNEAVVTRGGVNVKELNPATMESKKVHGLFFAGEVIDVDASTGGFNLQLAWSTGYAAGIGASHE